MTVHCDDKSLLTAYLYDECTPTEREAFEDHLAGCPACAAEVGELRGVRRSLREWAPPEHALGFRVVREEVRPRRSFWPAVPAWAQFAAAVLVLAAGAAIANLDVRIGGNGFEVRTGWSKPQAVTDVGARAVAGAPWRPDLAALERSLRHDLAPPRVTVPLAAGPTAAPGSSNAGGTISATDAADLIRRIQVMIDERERRQQQAFETMLATRMVDLARDVETQRRADLLRIQQGIGQVEGRTTSEVAQLREVQRYLMRVANIEIK